MSFPTFIALNKPIDCSALQPGQTVCLERVGVSSFPAYSCNIVYTMPLSLETCDTVAAKNKISVGILLFYNAGLDCLSLQRGQEICVDVSNFSTIFPLSSTLATSSITTSSTSFTTSSTSFTTPSFSTISTTPISSSTTTSTSLTTPSPSSNTLATSSISNSIPSQCTRTYTVKSGDYCIAIARDAQMSFPSFIALNKPIDCSALQPGQTVCLERLGVSSFPAYTCNSVYTMPLTLETCDTVAAKNKISVGTLLFYNPGLDCLSLQRGQEFCIDVSHFSTVYPQI
jgi:LysM repeat protein